MSNNSAPSPHDPSRSKSQAPGAVEKFHITIIGSGPIGKLLMSSVKSHPRIVFSQVEADELPLRPSFGYGIGPQTLRAAEAINADLGRQLRERCFLGPVWMNFYHGGEEDCLIEPVKVPESEGGLYGRLGRRELMDLLDSFGPSSHRVEYGKRLENIRLDDDGMLRLNFKDGTETQANAVWGCDGMNSVCRRYLQDEVEATQYSGMLAFRGRVSAESVRAEVGRGFDSDTFMCLGVKGWHILVFPIDSGEFVNIAAFCVEPDHGKKGRGHRTTEDELLAYFPGRSATVDRLLHLLAHTPGGPQRLELNTIGILPPFFNKDLSLTTFGDAANGMLPHIAGSMSTGVIGVATFLRELNPLIESMTPDATNTEIAAVLVEASTAYERKHRPLAQTIHDHSAEQGTLWSSGLVDVEKLSERPKFLWKAANSLLEDV